MPTKDNGKLNIYKYSIRMILRQVFLLIQLNRPYDNSFIIDY